MTVVMTADPLVIAKIEPDYPPGSWGAIIVRKPPTPDMFRRWAEEELLSREDWAKMMPFPKVPFPAVYIPRTVFEEYIRTGLIDEDGAYLRNGKRPTCS
jgi:hypothetical protein